MPNPNQVISKLQVPLNRGWSFAGTSFWTPANLATSRSGCRTGCKSSIRSVLRPEWAPANSMEICGPHLYFRPYHASAQIHGWICSWAFTKMNKTYSLKDCRSIVESQVYLRADHSTIPPSAISLRSNSILIVYQTYPFFLYISKSFNNNAIIWRC